jgi:integrase/recombinase XerD
MITMDLHTRLDRYVALRRALGFEIRPEERLLRDLVCFVERRGVGTPLTAKLALEWACSGAGQRARRLHLAGAFFAHLRAFDPSVQVPGRGLLARPIRPKPHIYDEGEIKALLAAAYQLGPHGSLRPQSLATIFGLVASCGLRASEAVRLRLEHVDLDAQWPCLRIERTKFRKSRLVPIHVTTAAALRAYANQRARLGYDGFCDFFFVSERCGPYRYRNVARVFLAVARRLGLRGPAGSGGPSLHDLRHTFAVRRLAKWYGEGADISARVPELSVYLGHVHPKETYWYLSASPQLLSLAADRFDTYARERGDQ